MAKKKQKINNLFLIIAAILAVIALINLSVTLTKVGNIKELTGYATDTGAANLTIESYAAINFTTDNIDWGTGTVDTVGGYNKSYLDTKSGSIMGGNWTSNSAGLVVENIGNINVSLDIKSGKNAASFIGGTNPSYQWLFEEAESGSCAENWSSFGEFGGVNTTSPGTRVCYVFGFVNSADSMRIHFNITVPYDSIPGAKGDVITATVAPSAGTFCLGSDDDTCGTISCSGWYIQTGTEGADTIEYCYDKADITSDRCENINDCKDANTDDCSSQSNDDLEYSCGLCRYISASSCTGTTLGSCSVYNSGETCGSGKICNAHGDCIDSGW